MRQRRSKNICLDPMIHTFILLVSSIYLQLQIEAYRKFIWNFKANEARAHVLDPAQTIIVMGESWAGKTETAKHIIRFLCFGTSQGLMDKMTGATTILDAFGNAKTELNHNSKFFQVGSSYSSMLWKFILLSTVVI